MNLNNPTGIRFVEFKSYQEETELAKGAINQFLGYLSDARLTSVNQLLYVFNAKKTDVIAAKEIMRKVFKDNAEKIWTVRPTFFSNISPAGGTPLQFFEDLESYAKNENLKADFYSKILSFVTTN